MIILQSWEATVMSVRTQCNLLYRLRQKWSSTAEVRHGSDMPVLFDRTPPNRRSCLKVTVIDQRWHFMYISCVADIVAAENTPYGPGHTKPRIEDNLTRSSFFAGCDTVHISTIKVCRFCTSALVLRFLSTI